MKTLVISLLRLGDIIQCAPALKGLKEQNPKGEVHLLINSQFAGLKNLLPAVDKVHLFEREQLQKALGEGGRPVFEAFDRCNELVERLREEGYTRVINLTHNRLSAWLATLLRAPDVTGLSYSDNGTPVFGGLWFRYLNSQMSSRTGDPFHYADLLYFSAGLREPRHPIELRETADGRAQAEERLAGLRDFVAIQPLTSDTKKNWPLDRFAEVIKTVSVLHPGISFVILGSPAEEPRLSPFVRQLRDSGLNVRGSFDNLETTYSILKKARAILTGDTSIKHLASATDARIVELSIGSSDYRKTGAYSAGSVIIQSREPCAPCPHSMPCTRDHHACAKKIPSELVSLVMNKVLGGQMNELRLLAREYQKDAEVLRTAFSESGYWTYHSLLPADGERSVARLIDLSSWKLYLDPDPTAAIGEFGTEGVRVRRALKAAFPETSGDDWLDHVNSLENELERFESRLSVFLIDFKAYLKKYERRDLFDQLCNRVKTYFEKAPPAASLTSYKNEIEGVLGDLTGAESGDFVKIRKLNDSLLRAHQRLEIELRLLKSFKTNVMESI